MALSRRQFLSFAALGGPGLIATQSGSATPDPLFEEIPTANSGITWVHDNAVSDDHYLPETLGPGCAFLDYDNDGWMDIFLVNSGPSDFFKSRRQLRNAMYKNNRDGTFKDVTETAGLAGGSTFGMGVAVGDYDNNGFPDLFVSAYGRPTLYRNNGNGTFTDVTDKSGLLRIPELLGWTTSAVWFDYDNDGRLDLFVCSFVDYGKTQHFSCGDNRLGRKYYCIPRAFRPTRSFLFHNNGDGTFTEAGANTDIGRSLGKGLGVVATDINNDGKMDLFVANDTVQNFLFVNRGNGKWEEVALTAEVGFGENGQARSGMGVDAADFDGDGWQDLFVANVDHEMFSLYRNNRDGNFSDVGHANGVAQATRLLSGWGLKFFDYDNDGFVDLILANGHPDDMIEMYSSQVTYRETLLLFHNDGGKFRNVSAEAGSVFTRKHAGRGLAVGDFDNDGRLDVLLATNGGAPLLLRNKTRTGNHWLGIRARGSVCNRDAIGARITWSAGGIKRTRLKNNGGSYLSSHDPREILGLGKTERLDWLEIRWPSPSGRVDRFTNLAVDRYIEIVEGKGIIGEATRRL